MRISKSLINKNEPPKINSPPHRENKIAFSLMDRLVVQGNLS